MLKDDANMRETNLLDSLSLPRALRSRVNCFNDQLVRPDKKKSFVLYLPMVNLRMRHNAAFALACRLANQLNVPLLTMAVIPDKSHHSGEKNDGKVFLTARRLAFILEALQECTQQWSKHGSLVMVRILGQECSSPDHLILASRAMAVVTDEPFVHPFLHLVQSTEDASKSAGTPCFRVDASTTVPPASILERRQIASDKVLWGPAPTRAYLWNNKTQKHCMAQYDAAMAGDFDAPPLHLCVPDFIDTTIFQLDITDEFRCLKDNFPKSWIQCAEAPGKRPWTVSELLELGDCKSWAMKHWPSTDTSVPPCKQTVGSGSAGLKRWKDWLHRGGLSKYARSRNNAKQPHAVSRMSCYLNYGIVSIFDIYDDIMKYSSSAREKFVDELIKWREFSYAHSFCRTDYFERSCIPPWAQQFLESGGSSGAPTLEQMISAKTNDEKWNAMQRYLIETGELHNNVRMSWGRTIVFWGRQAHWSCDQILESLCILNDRFALDGISPPSYAGLLWCCGWGDKPLAGGKIKPKPASQYMVSPQGFEQSHKLLLHNPCASMNSQTIRSFATTTKKRNIASTSASRKDNISHQNSTPTILQYMTQCKKRNSGPSVNKISNPEMFKEFITTDTNHLSKGIEHKSIKNCIDLTEETKCDSCSTSMADEAQIVG